MRCGLRRCHGEFCGHHAVYLQLVHRAFDEGLRLAPGSNFQRVGIAAITVSVFSPGIGMLFDRFPPRRIILPSILIFASAYASLSLLTPNISRFYLTYFVLGVVGNGTAQLAYTRAVLTWFQKHRGIALALVLTGSGTGSIVDSAGDTSRHSALRLATRLSGLGMHCAAGHSADHASRT